MLSTCVLFISVMQSVNSTKLLNTACLLFQSAVIAVSSAPTPRTVISPLIVPNLYASLKSHKIDFSIEVLKLI